MLNKEEHDQLVATLNKMVWAALNKYTALQKQIDELMEFTYGRKPSEIDKPQKCPPKTIYNAARAQLDKLFIQADAAWGIYLSASAAETKAYDMPYIFSNDEFGLIIIKLASDSKDEANQIEPSKVKTT